MEWIELIDVEKVCWSLASQAFGFWLCWITQAKPAKKELEQLKKAAMKKVVSIKSHIADAESLLERLSKDYPHLMNVTPKKSKSPYVSQQWRRQ